MVDEVPEGDHIDFEVLSVFNSGLVVRFRLNDKRMDMIVNWNGQGDVIEFLKQQALAVASQFKIPPPTPFDLLQQQVGKQGHIIVPPTPV